MASPHSPKQHHILASLPAEDYTRLLPDLELIPMPLGWAAYESGGHMNYMYFPTSSVVSLLYVMENGASAEIAITGNCGLVGISLFMGGESTPSRAVVQSAGNGYRLRASVLKREFAMGANLQHLALRYTQALITQMAQELIANMLGVHREGVTAAAGKLQADGLIHYSRGHIKVLDRARLEQRVCECYAVVKKEYDRLLPYKLPGLPNTAT